MKDALQSRAAPNREVCKSRTLRRKIMCLSTLGFIQKYVFQLSNPPRDSDLDWYLRLKPYLSLDTPLQDLCRLPHYTCDLETL